MKKTSLLVLGLTLCGAVTLCAADNKENALYRKLHGGAQTAPQAAAAPAPTATPAPAQPVKAVPIAKEDCGKKKPKNHGKGWAKGHDKNC